MKSEQGGQIDRNIHKAELAEKYLKQGSIVHVEGKNRTRSHEDKPGVKRYVTEVVREEIIVPGKKEG